MTFNFSRAAACERKRAFDTVEAALESAFTRNYHDPQVYECSFCGRLHLTRIRTEIRAKQKSHEE